MAGQGPMSSSVITSVLKWLSRFKKKHLLLEAKWVPGLWETDKHNGLFKQKEKMCLSRACAISTNFITGLAMAWSTAICSSKFSQI